MSTKKMFKDKPIVTLAASDRLQQNVLNDGDHYQLASWNSIHYITAISDTQFRLDETLGEPIKIGTEYALIINSKQEDHIPTKRTVVTMANHEAKEFKEKFLKQAYDIAIKN